MEHNSRRRPQQPKPQPSYSKAYIESIRQFLTTHKTIPCALEYTHEPSSCQYHHGSDARRNPYQQHSFAYYPSLQLLQEVYPGGELNSGMLCLNNEEQIYHPVLYKVARCGNFYGCGLGLLCPNLHGEEQKVFQYGEFFRFDIRTHKTKPCPRRDFHERKTCVYYHNDSDRRRPNFDDYSHQLCTRSKCDDQKCHFSHNKIEQVYHPSRYKSKFCKTYTNKNIKCQYKEFCAFAHAQSQIKIQMIHLLNKDYDFYLQKYKTVWCPDTQGHQRGLCVYAHNIQDFRRNPFKYSYEPEKCQFWNFDDQLKSLEDSGCKAGMNCDKCHGWMEQKYHPQVYKKTKVTESKDANLIIEKKIVNNPKDTKDGKEKGRIQKVIEEKVSQISKTAQNNTIRDVGAPFFKKQANSESSRKTKALTTNFQSDDNSVKQENHGTNVQYNEARGIANRKKSMFFLSEEDIWRSNPDEGNNEIQKKLDEERARSENKFDDCQTVYSHSLKQAVGDNSILRKLKNNNIHELRLKNLSHSQIDQFKFLNKNEKDQLNHKIKLYQLRRERNPVIYNLQLTKFFIKNNQESILQKTKAKKIKQQKLLSLKNKQIEKLEFLCEAERQVLPVLIGQYKKYRNQQEFCQISEEISRFVSPKRTPRQS